MICLEKVAHIILLFLITTKDTNLFDVAIKKATKHSISKTACTTCYQ